MDVAIIGAGVGGLTAALAIHHQGIDCRVRVYDSAREIRPLGVGINLLPHCGRELAELGLVEGLRRAAVEPKEFGWFTHHGQLIHTEPCGLRAGDGINSVLRKQFYPDEGPPVFSKVNIWRGVTKAKPYLSGGTICRIGGIFTTNKAVVYPIRNDIDGKGTQLVNWAV